MDLYSYKKFIYNFSEIVGKNKEYEVLEEKYKQMEAIKDDTIKSYNYDKEQEISSYDELFKESKILYDDKNDKYIIKENNVELTLNLEAMIFYLYYKYSNNIEYKICFNENNTDNIVVE